MLNQCPNISEKRQNNDIDLDMILSENGEN